ncbi:SH3 domain-containing protein [Microbispora sp. CA-102843]|uniref:SH3 domain-containing protein n=1 Tax=Microbispora sp. CA-102843 TaxID=3239952 RepID=UPI003D8A95E2
MALSKRIVPALALCAAAGWLTVVPAAAQATTRSTGVTVHHSAHTCSYRVWRLRPGSHLNVRKGPGLHHRPIGRLHRGDRHVAGSCGSRGGWIAVKLPGGGAGWASGYYLRGTSATTHPSRPHLRCDYQVTRVRTGSFLNVRKGPGVHHRPIGRLRPGDGRVPGSCGSRGGWIAVKLPDGRVGWASSHYLHKIR